MLVSTCLWIVLRIRVNLLYSEIPGIYAPGTLMLESSGFPSCEKKSEVCPLESTEKDTQNNG